MNLILTDHRFSLPLDYADPKGEHITVYAREVVSPGKQGADLPWLVFLQGGPGFGAPRPTGNSGWLKRALQEFRVLLLDQRGTGLSSPVTAQSLGWRSTVEEQVSYLTHFRADSIIRDLEEIRVNLVGQDGRWSILGQSYGGFCAVHYLSAFPESLNGVFIAGGLPSLWRSADEVYRATYKRVLAKNELYYQRYPQDGDVARDIVDYLSSHEVCLPAGDRLSPRRFQQLGWSFGGSDGFEGTHYLLEGAFVNGPSGTELSERFIRGISTNFSFEANPISAILHESIYCQNDASNWSASRILEEYPEFKLDTGGRVMYTGEMIYPWMFDEYVGLKPMKAAANIIAAYTEWPPLYDIEVLKRNTVPSAAVAYYNDMYVERTFSEETASDINGLKLWVTSEYEHNGLRADGERVFGRLLEMVRDT